MPFFPPDLCPSPSIIHMMYALPFFLWHSHALPLCCGIHMLCSFCCGIHMLCPFCCGMHMLCPFCCGIHMLCPFWGGIHMLCPFAVVFTCPALLSLLFPRSALLPFCSQTLPFFSIVYMLCLPYSRNFFPPISALLPYALHFFPPPSSALLPLLLACSTLLFRFISCSVAFFLFYK